MWFAIDSDRPDILIGRTAAFDPYAWVGFLCHTRDGDRLQCLIFALCESTFGIHCTASAIEGHYCLTIFK